MARLARNRQFESLNLQVFHERLHAVGDGTEVVVVHLLVLCRVVSHQRAACKHQVGSCAVESLVNQEILLFPSKVACNLVYRRVEKPAHVCRRDVYGVHRAQQRSLVVESLACVRDEYRRNTKRVVYDEHGRCGVPCRVSACLEGVADAAVGERAGVRFLLYKQLSGELFNHSALAVVLYEGIVLLRRSFRQGLEPVGVVCHAVLLRPLFHAGGHGVGNGAVERRTVVDNVDKLVIYACRQVFVHLRTVKNVFPEKFRGTFYRRDNF